MKPYEKLLRHWHDADAKMNVVEVELEDVDRLEQRYGIRLPPEFRDYLLYCTPKDEWSSEADFENTYVTWWSLDRIKNIPEEYDHKISNEVIANDAAKYIFFADYSIWCWAWAICCDEGENWGRIALVGGRPDRFVADSFAQFVEMYVEDGGASKRLSAC